MQYIIVLVFNVSDQCSGWTIYFLPRRKTGGGGVTPTPKQLFFTSLSWPQNTLPLGMAHMLLHGMGSFWSGSAGLGWARLGSAGLGSAGLGLAGLGLACFGSARLGWAGLGSARLAWAGMGSVNRLMMPLNLSGPDELVWVGH